MKSFKKCSQAQPANPNKETIRTAPTRPPPRARPLYSFRRALCKLVIFKAKLQTLQTLLQKKKP